MFKKKIPVIPAFIVSDSAAEADDKKSTFNESFVYCPDIKTDQLDTLKKSYRRKTDEQYTHESKYDITLERKSVKDLVHLITSELKRKGVKTPLLILPFRPSHHDEDLKRFLDRIFVKGVPVDEKTATDIIQDTNEYILMSALKFIWCRLPGKAVIGWKAYTEFVKLEENAGFPDKAFLEFMPNCLSSGAHASIVYDFFDLIVAFVLNSKDNLMTATKFSKVCGLWAFNPVRNKVPGSPSFERGLYEWIPASDAMFHLLLAFVKSMPPNGDSTKLPKIFQILLKKTDYPPLPTSATLENSRQLQEIPIVTIRSNNPCKNPAELLTRVNKTLKFNDPTVFYTREDFLLLKRIFKEKDAVAEKLSSESSRILENLCLFDKDLINDGKDSSELKYKLVPGWSTDMTSRHLTDAEKDINDFFTASVGRASIDDYFIWAWLASLGIEETDLKKKTFGKTYIMEVELAEGFKKWVIVEEQDLERDGYDIELEIKQQKLKQLEKQIHLAELEAKKIKKKALLEAERLEIERYEAKKLKDQTLANKLTSSSPPPLPAKDYDNDIPPRSKSRKPPPKSLTTDEYTIPNKSNKRKLVNGSSVEKNNEEIDSFNKLGDIRISLPELDIDDSFLKHDLLEVLDSDFTVDTAARVRGSNDGSPNYDSTTHKNNISNAYRGVPNDASYGSPDRNKQMVTPERQSPPKGYLNYNPNGNNISPARSSSPQRPGLPLGTNHQPYYGSPPRTAYPPGSGSPPRTAYPPRSASPPRTAYPPRSASPPRTAYPPGSGSPPRAAYPPRSGSPPRTAYPPRSASPPRAAYLPQTKPASPSAFYQQTRVPQQISPPQRSDYPNEFASQKRFSLPNMPESSEISAPTIPSSAGPRRPNSQQPETISSSYPQIGSLENETSTNNVYKSQQFPSLRNGIKYDHDNIPILPPPDVASVVESDLLSETSIPFRSPVTKAQLENSFDNLENDFKDCMQNLNDLESQIDNSEKRQVSSSRVRKAPPQSVKQITVSGSSSSYPPTHVTVAQENTESLPLLSTADNSRKSSTQASRQSKSSNTAASNISEGNISIDSRFSPPNGLPVNYPPPSAHSNAMQYPTKSPKPPPMPYGTHQHQTPQYSPSMAFSPPQFPQQHQRPSPKNPRNRLSKVPPMGQYPPGYPPQAGYPQGYFPQGYPPGYPAQPPNMGYPPVYSTPVLNTGYPQGYYQPMPGVPPGMTNNGSGSFPADPTMSPYSNNVINHMPPTGRIDKLHGPQNINKKNARDAFMSGDFGI